MDLKGAILFLPREGGGKPTLLKDLLFQPAAVWLREALKARGAQHFFVVCHQGDREEAAACFPENAELVTEGSPDAAERLSAFLAAQEGGVAVVTQPVLLGFTEGVQEGGAPGICAIPADTLARELAGGGDFGEALAAHGSGGGLAEAATPLSGGAYQWMLCEQRAKQLGAMRLLEMGARVMDLNSVYADPTVSVGGGTVILPGTILRGDTVIGKDCEIGPNSMITDCTVGDGVVINASQLNQSIVEDAVKMGPFAYVRPGCRIGRGVKVGDFVELKNSQIGEGTKISHLTYVGDSDVGAGVNFGCGTVTVNYDGTTKFRTVIGDHAFIGCNTNLVAPVRVGEGAYTAAGSTITDDVPTDSLAIARSQQVVKKQWAAKRRKRGG